MNQELKQAIEILNGRVDRTKIVTFQVPGRIVGAVPLTGLDKVYITDKGGRLVVQVSNDRRTAELIRVMSKCTSVEIDNPADTAFCSIHFACEDGSTVQITQSA